MVLIFLNTAAVVVHSYTRTHTHHEREADLYQVRGKILLWPACPKRPTRAFGTRLFAFCRLFPASAPAGCCCCFCVRFHGAYPVPVDTTSLSVSVNGKDVDGVGVGGAGVGCLLCGCLLRGSGVCLLLACVQETTRVATREAIVGPVVLARKVAT